MVFSKSNNYKLFISSMICLGLFLFLFLIQTKTDIKIEDKKYIKLIIAENGYGMPNLMGEQMEFEKQIKLIKQIQQAVLKSAPTNKGIEYYHTREPKDLYKAQYGLCYDRSRTIEKILTMYGFKIRHISIFSLQNSQSKLLALLKPATPSHAINEVKTKKGWMVVDSNEPWISLTKQNKPISLAEIEKYNIGYEWLISLNNCIYKQSFTYVYGLYSRHGKFYPPYPSPFPNINWRQFSYNFIE